MRLCRGSFRNETRDLGRSSCYAPRLWSRVGCPSTAHNLDAQDAPGSASAPGRVHPALRRAGGENAAADRKLERGSPGVRRSEIGVSNGQSKRLRSARSRMAPRADRLASLSGKRGTSRPRVTQGPEPSVSSQPLAGRERPPSESRPNVSYFRSEE